MCHVKVPKQCINGGVTFVMELCSSLSDQDNSNHAGKRRLLTSEQMFYII